MGLLPRLRDARGHLHRGPGTISGYYNTISGIITLVFQPYLASCDSYDQGLPLELVEGWSQSKLLGEVMIIVHTVLVFNLIESRQEMI